MTRLLSWRGSSLIYFWSFPRSPNRPQHPPHYNKMRHLWAELHEHRDAWPFHYPVNKDEVQDYYSVIKDPMGGLRNAMVVWWWCVVVVVVMVRCSVGFAGRVGIELAVLWLSDKR